MGSLIALVLYGSLVVTWLAPIATAQRRIVVPWSTKTYGPDGPWQAVKIKVGGNDTKLKIDAQNHADLDVYPGGTHGSLSFNKQACQDYPDSTCGAGGTWEPDEDATSVIPPNGWHVPYIDDSYGLWAGPMNQTGRAMTIGGATVWNTSLIHTNVGNITHFDGQVSGMILGTLALGGDQTTQVFSTSDEVAGKDLSFNLFNGWLFDNGTLASYSFTLHIGSAAYEYPGSLVFGGYNRGRAIGPYCAWRAGPKIEGKDGPWDNVELQDIGIGVEDGDSPFDFQSKDKLLKLPDSNEPGKLAVRIDPLTPYISLPANTCEGLQDILPIKFDEITKYYLWQTEDPKFKKIVTSSAYLSFAFPPPRGGTDNVIIKVPFALLNLTLDTPIVGTPTQYFPCHSYDPETGKNNDKTTDPYRLGRAFLQAAFFGRNWRSQTTWLAQAPGPGDLGEGIGEEIRDIGDGDTDIDVWDGKAINHFNQTWAKHWSIIDSPKPQGSTTAQPSPSASNSPSPSSTGMSTGTKAGIGVGVSFGCLAAIGAGLLLWRRRRNGYTKAVQGTSDPNMPPRMEKYRQYHNNAHELQDVMPGDVHGGAREMHVGFEMQEAPDRNDPRMS